MSTRLFAWLLDGVILGGFQLGFWMFAAAVGAMSINPAAQQQIEASPMALPSVAPYQANLPQLGALLVIFVMLNVGYATLFWARFRGLPGQRMTSLQVASAETGKNLSWGKAFARAVVAVGVPVGALAVILYSAMAIETMVPWSEIMNSSSGAPTSPALTGWSLVLDAAMLVAVLLPAFLLVVTAASETKQGPHDRLAGSLVVGQGHSPKRAQGYGWGQNIDPTRAPGYWPGYGTPPTVPGSWPTPAPGAPLGTPAAHPGTAPALDDRPIISGDPETGWSVPALPEEPLPGTGGSVGTSAGAPDGSAAPWRPTPPPPEINPWLQNSGWNSRPGPNLPPISPESPWLRTTEDNDLPGKTHAATVGRRGLAYILDCMLIYGAWSMLALAITSTVLPPGTGNNAERDLILIGLAGGLLQLAYFTICWRFWRGTLGQRITHLEVVSVTGGKAISLMDAIVRWAVLQGPFAAVTIAPQGVRLFLLLAAISWTIFLFYSTQNSAETRGLHDRVAGSRVSLEL
ncbi:MAG TPA: RDD family protein [Candidatus Limnocylindrales bacterium]